MNIKNIIIYTFLSSIIIMQDFDETTFICGPKKERKTMCRENNQFLQNYWLNSDYDTVVELAYNHILCGCTDGDDEQVYLLYGQAYYNLGNTMKELNRLDEAKENYLEAFKLILKKSIHVTLLNPFHIYSDHNFISGEKYYTTETHDKLVPVRIIYTLIIYIISLVGFYNLLKNKEYKLLSFLMISMIYFYGMVSWHGNTRYFVPVLIYLSFFFGFSFQNFRIKNIIRKLKIIY